MLPSYLDRAAFVTALGSVSAAEWACDAGSLQSAPLFTNNAATWSRHGRADEYRRADE
jgi:hypothetical protein